MKDYTVSLYPSFENIIFGEIFAMPASVKKDVNKFKEVHLLDRQFFSQKICLKNCLV
jgi:hypothetical protein